MAPLRFFAPILQPLLCALISSPKSQTEENDYHFLDPKLRGSSQLVAFYELSLGYLDDARIYERLETKISTRGIFKFLQAFFELEAVNFLPC